MTTMIILSSFVLAENFEEPNFLQRIIGANWIRYKGIEITPMTKEDRGLSGFDFEWYTNESTKVFYPILDSPREFTEFHYFTQALSTPEICTKHNQYYSSCSKEVLDFTTFEEKNNVTTKECNIMGIGKEAKEVCVNKTNKKIEEVYEGKEFLGYRISYYGSIFNLDPEFNKVYSSSSDLEIFGEQTNRTEATNLGARLHAPVLFMDFNKDREGSYIQDNSIYNNYGDSAGASNATYNSSCEGRTFDDDGCYEFDGVDDYIELGSATLTTGATTVSMWVNKDDATQDPLGAFVIGSTGQTLFYWGSSDQAAAAMFGFRGEHEMHTLINTLTANVWEHIVFIYDGNDDDLVTSYKIYINGVSTPVYRKGGTIGGSGTINRIGRENAGAFPGQIDQVQIFDRVLTADEVLNLYNGTNNNSDYIGKYARDGDFKSLVFYNSSPTHWNVTMSLADSNGTAITQEKCDSDVNCVSYWNLDGNYNDSKGANEGTPTGTNNATGISSGAMRFDGVDDFVSISDDDSLDITCVWSFSFWANINTVAQTSNPILQKRSTETNPWGLVINLDEIQLYDGIVYPTTTGINFNSKEWYHIALTHDACNPNSAKVYVNGEYKEALASGNFTSNTNDLYIGFDGSSGHYFNGSIDEVLIYNKSLTSSEVEELYKAGLSQHANANVTLQTRTATSYNISDGDSFGIYGMNERTSSSSSFDETGFSNAILYDAGVEINTNTISIDDCPVGTCFDFTKDDYANGDYLDLGNSFNSVLNSNFTMTFWMRADDGRPAVTGEVFGTTNIDGNDRFLLLNRNAGDLELVYKQGGVTVQADTGVYLPNGDTGWMFIVTEGNPVSLNLYRDGGIIATADMSGRTMSNLALTNNLTFGGLNYRTNGVLEMWDGKIDEVRIYNRSLSADEIQNLYELGGYHIEWKEWSPEVKMQDGIGNVTTRNGSFYQFKANFNTDDTDVSPYLLNHSINKTSVAAPAPPDSAPTVAIVYPTATTYESEVTILNFTSTDDNGISMCWHNTTGSNSTPVSNQNYTGLSSEKGTNIWAVYCNDTTNQIGSDTVQFVYNDSTNPTVSITSPEASKIYGQVPMGLTCSIEDTNHDTSWWTVGVKNTSFAGNTTTMNLNYTATFTVQVYANDTFGNLGGYNVTFDYAYGEDEPDIQMKRIQVWYYYNSTSGNYINVSYIGLDGRYCNLISGVCTT